MKDAAPQTALLSSGLIFKLDLRALAEQVSSFSPPLPALRCGWIPQCSLRRAVTTNTGGLCQSLRVSAVEKRPSSADFRIGICFPAALASLSLMPDMMRPRHCLQQPAYGTSISSSSSRNHGGAALGCAPWSLSWGNRGNDGEVEQAQTYNIHSLGQRGVGGTHVANHSSRVANSAKQVVLVGTQLKRP